MPFLPLLVLLAVLALGCDELDEFSTGPDEVFRGQVVGADRDGGMSFIRSGFAPHTLMELTFDAARASASGEMRSAGTITTYTCPDGGAQCAAGEREPGHFRAAELERIPNLTNDALSQYDFPGGGRLRNYIFGARFEGSDGAAARGRDAMVFLSLMENGEVEVRVIAQSVLDASGARMDEALFGVFPLERRAR